MTSSFERWFEDVTAFAPHAWQLALGTEHACSDRLLRIPTGFGKTAGAVLSWAYHRVVRNDATWPTRLVFCLPMRVLVEQTERSIEAWFEKAKLDVPVIVLLGGRAEEGWLEHPERPAVVIGTQDMLLSRALTRGYGSTRGLWPMEMGMVHGDALWVIDEVQLMDVGLATSAQLHAFRVAEAKRTAAIRPTFTWWMSATLQPSWLETIDFNAVRDTRPRPAMRIESAQRHGGLWDVKKRLERRADIAAPEEVAALVRERHRPGSMTLVVVNTVDRAKRVDAAVSKLKVDAELRLVHSRFRAKERALWDFLRRDAPIPAQGRIVVATQVVEAGVDISAATLLTDLAPWSSLVQRFGRCARYAGEAGDVIVVGAPDEKRAAPYDVRELDAAAVALERLVASSNDAGPRALETFEEGLAENEPALLSRMYPYAPFHVIRRRDFDELFDTTPDLSGADLDVSRYIRSGDDRDVSVFWRPIDDVKSKEITLVVPPARDELCPVPIGELREYLKARSAWTRDYVNGTWKRVERIVPGLTIMLAASGGGYAEQRGWDPKSATPVSVVDASVSPTDALRETAASADDDTLSAARWKSIATHGRETGQIATTIASALGLPSSLARILALAGRWHDAGKVHDEFQNAIRVEARATEPMGERRDLAKAPSDAWRRPPYPRRPGFRHELASTLMLFELLRRAAPDHPALTNAHAEVFTAMGVTIERVTDEALMEHALARELAQLSSAEFDLVAYLVCSHHGKIRTSWSSTPRDQEAEHGGIHGVCEGDTTGAFLLVDETGARHEVPPTTLSLAPAALGLNVRYGASWADRVANLLEQHGPFTLAYLEGILRAADWRASQLDSGEDQ